MDKLLLGLVGAIVFSGQGYLFADDSCGGPSKISETTSLSVPSGTQASAATGSAEATGPGYDEAKLPYPVLEILRRLRATVGDGESDWYWENVGVAKKDKGKLIHVLGPMAQRGDLTVYGFLEDGPMAFSCNGYTHLVLYQSSNQPIAKEVFHDLPHIVFMRNQPPDPMVWFEDFGDPTEPFLAVKRQYHNGTWNVLGVQYFELNGLKLKEAFQIAAEQEDRVAEAAPAGSSGCFDPVEASVYGDRGPGGAARIAWKVLAGCAGHQFLISTGHLVKVQSGKFAVSDKRLLRPEYKDFLDPFDVEYPHY
jgi:hypothetical protein